MKKRMLLVTQGFPFGESERGFLSEEVRQLVQTFDLFILAPDNQDKLLYPTDGILKIERYRFSSFRGAGNIRALFQISDSISIAEAWQFAKKNCFSNVLGDVKEILLFRYHAWEVEQQILQLVETEKIDIIYTYWCTECTLAAIYVKRRFPKVKVITRFHGYDLFEERTKLGWQPFRKAIAAGCDALYFACEMGRSYFLKHWGSGFEEKTHTCYLGSVGLGGIGSVTGEKEHFDILHLVSCSNLIPLKRVELIIDALALLPKSVKVEWNHFGDGSERQALEKHAAQKFQVNGNIVWKFHGKVPNQMILPYYRELGAQLFITTSSTEGGVPVSMQECASLGIPIVGTAVGGVPELVIDGKTGFLLPENPHAEEVAGTIMKYLSMTQLQWQEMSDSIQKLWQDKFNAEKNAKEFIILLKKILSE